MKLLISILTCLSVVMTIGCGESEHRKTAKDFVNTLNNELGYDVELVKTNTKQRDYIVVRDYDLGTLDAYYIGGYNSSSNINDYLDQNEDLFYYGLEFAYVEVDRYYVPGPYYSDPIFGYSTIGGGYYEETYENVYVDPFSGVLFSKVKMTPTDLSKAMEVLDKVRINNAKQKLMVQFGLPPQRAGEVASHWLQLKKDMDSKATMTTYKFDQYSKAIIGSSFTEMQEPMKRYLQGDVTALDKFYKRAADTNGVSIESVRKLSDIFVKN